MKERKDLKFMKKNEIAKLSFEDLKKEIVRSEKLLFSLKMKLSV